VVPIKGRFRETPEFEKLVEPASANYVESVRVAELSSKWNLHLERASTAARPILPLLPQIGLAAERK
jgi:hypothetical protein